MVFRSLAEKGVQKVRKKIRGKRDSFYGYFPSYFSISCNISIEEYIINNGKNIRLSKKKPISLGKNVLFYFSEKQKKWNFTLL
jgi:hypothetical protein